MNRSATPLQHLLAALACLCIAAATFVKCRAFYAECNSHGEVIRWLHFGEMHKWKKPSEWIENQPKKP